METFTDAANGVIDTLGPVGTAAAVAGLVVLALLLVTLIVGRRRRTRSPDVPHTTTSDEPDLHTAPIRRPIYADPLLLDDLLAHAEPADYGRQLRRTLDDDVDTNAAETRKLNKTLAGLDARGLLVDLHAEADAPLAPGSAVLVTGTLEELPASAVAELLELSAPVFAHSAHHAGNGDGGEAARRLPEHGWGDAARVLCLTPTEGDRRYLIVLHPDGFREPARRSLDGEVHVLGVVEDVLGRRDKLGVDDYLPGYLSPELRERTRGADLGEVAESVAKLAGRSVKRRDLTFEGPGARLSAAAIYR